MKEKKKYASNRFWSIFIVIAVVAFISLIGLIKVMFFENSYWQTVFSNYSKNSYQEPAVRGSIISADGKELSVSLPEYEISFDPILGNKMDQQLPRVKKKQKQLDSLLNVKVDSIVWGMKKILPSLNPIALKKTILDGRAKGKRYIKLYDKRVTYLQLLEIKQLPLCGQPYFCLKADAHNRRKYPYGRMAIRTIGRMHKKEDKPETGLEYEYNEELKGSPGRYHYEKVRGQAIKTIDVPSERGADLYTTLDVGMQDMVEKTLHKHLRAMNAHLGMCILMEVATGDVKAISSLTRLQDGTFREIQSYAVGHMRMPGSTVKAASIMTALDDGRISMSDSVDTGNGVKLMYGEYMKDSDYRRGGNGVLSVLNIMAKSSNVGIATLIDDAYRRDPKNFIAGWQRIGLLEDLQLPIRGYAKPTTPQPGQKKWARTTLPWMSVGYESQIPPISILNFYNGIANGGRLMRPRFVTAIKKGNEVIREFPPVVLREHMCKPATLQNVQRCLEAAVTLKGATGKFAHSRHFKVAGKTGTAQIWEKDKKTDNYFISFVGYFPADAPQYSMIVCIEKKTPAYGGQHCAPIFKEVAERVMVRKYKEDYTTAVATHDFLRTPNVKAGNVAAIKHGLADITTLPTLTYDESSGILWGRLEKQNESLQMVFEGDTKNMPDLFNYSLRDAVFRLEKMGLKVKVKGIGAVTWQSIAPRHQVKQGDVVELVLSVAPYRDYQPRAEGMTSLTSIATANEQRTPKDDKRTVATQAPTTATKSVDKPKSVTEKTTNTADKADTKRGTANNSSKSSIKPTKNTATKAVNATKNTVPNKEKSSDVSKKKT